MKRIVYLTFTLAIALFVATDAQAQKWPERSRVRRGNRAYEQLDYDRAEERYREAQELSDTCFEAKFNLGDALYKQQRFDEAEKIFAALATDSTRSTLDRAHSYYNLGNTLFQQKKYQEALSAYKRSLRLNPADLETKYNYAYTKKYIEDNQQGGGGGGNNDQNQQNQNQDQNQQGDGQNDQQNNDQNNDQNQDNQNNNDQNDQGDNSQDKNDQNKGDDQQDKGNNKGNDDPNKGDNEGENDPQDGDQNGENDPNEGDQNGDQEPQQGDGEPQPSGLSQNDAERMLDAIQGEEDKTRDKVNAKVGQGVVRSGKNW